MNISSSRPVVIDQTLDSHTKLHVIFNANLRQVLKNLGLTKNKNSKFAENSEYTASGHWSSSKNEDGNPVITVDVGCYCDRDCCGHLCSLVYTLIKNGKDYIVITYKGFNF